MKKWVSKFKSLLFILLSFILTAYFFQDKKSKKLEGTIWVEMQDSIQVSSEYFSCKYFFYKNNKAIYFNCYEGDTIFCEYIFKGDTLIINHLKSSWDKTFPEGSIHRLQKYKIYFYPRNENYLIPLFVENSWFGQLERTPIINSFYLKKIKQ